MIEESLALRCGRLRGIAGGAARLKILCLPGEGGWAVCGKPAVILIHCHTCRVEIGNLVPAHMLRIACQHDRCFDRPAPHGTVTQILRGEQSLGRAETKPSRCHSKKAMPRAKILCHERHGCAV